MVHLIESVNSNDIRLKKMAVDGIQNTIKYEITSNIRFDQDKRLTVESELQEAIQAYGIDNPDTQLNLRSVSAQEVKLTYTISADQLFGKEECIELVASIFDECDHVR